MSNGYWGACDLHDERNVRTRSSVLLSYSHNGCEKNIVVDVGPDFRHQCLQEGIKKIDSVLMTHAHADHLHGLDDLRPFAFNHGPIPLYGHEDVLRHIEEGFGYAIRGKNPFINTHAFKVEESFELFGMEVKAILQKHGDSDSYGFVFPRFAYTTDLSEFSASSWNLLNELDLWVISCNNYTSNEKHAGLDQVLEWISQKNPKKAVLTHMGCNIDYSEIAKILPKNVIAAWDGMEMLL